MVPPITRCKPLLPSSQEPMASLAGDETQEGGGLREVLRLPAAKREDNQQRLKTKSRRRESQR